MSETTARKDEQIQQQANDSKRNTTLGVTERTRYMVGIAAAHERRSQYRQLEIMVTEYCERHGYDTHIPTTGAPTARELDLDGPSNGRRRKKA